MTYLDEVRAVGLYGEHGAASPSATAFASTDIIQGIGKAFGLWRYVAGSALMCDFLRSHAPGLSSPARCRPCSRRALAAVRHLE